MEFATKIDKINQIKDKSVTIFTNVYISINSIFLKLVQCQSWLNPEIQPFVVEGIGFTHN